MGLTGDDLVEQATLVFREQADGRKVARLPNGKVVMVKIEDRPKVKGGETWVVRLEHHETFATAILEQRLTEPEKVSPVGSSFSALGDIATIKHQKLPPKPPQPVSSKPPTPAKPSLGPEIESEKPAAVAPAAAKPAAAPSTPKVSLSTTAIPPSSVLRATDRVALFIDGANMDGACRDAGYWVDYSKARRFFTTNGQPYGAFYFTADFGNVDAQHARFLEALSHNGFVVRRKPIKKIIDRETGEASFKADVDVEVAIEVLNTADNWDVCFLFSGDSDFERLVDILRSRGKRVYAVTSRQSLSRELAFVADKPMFYIEDYKANLVRDDRPGP